LKFTKAQISEQKKKVAIEFSNRIYKFVNAYQYGLVAMTYIYVMTYQYIMAGVSYSPILCNS